MDFVLACVVVVSLFASIDAELQDTARAGQNWMDHHRPTLFVYLGLPLRCWILGKT